MPEYVTVKAAYMEENANFENRIILSPDFLGKASAVLDNSEEMISICEEDSYRLIYANRKALEYFKKAGQDYNGKKCYEFLSNLSAPCQHCPMSRIRAGENGIKSEITTIKKKHYSLYYKRAVLAGKKVLIEYGSDITESANQIKLFKRSLGTLTGSRMGTWNIITGNGNPRIYMNDTMAELAGVPATVTPEEAYSIILARVDPADKARFLGYRDNLLAGRRDEIEYTYLHPENGRLSVRCGGVMDKSYEGPGKLIRGYHQDITEQKKEEDKQKKLYENLLNESSQQITIRDAQTRELLFANSAALKAFPPTMVSFKGKKCHEFFMGSDVPCSYCPIPKLGKDQKEINVNVQNGQLMFDVKLVRGEYAGREVFTEYVTDVTSIYASKKNYRSAVEKILVDSPNIVRAMRINLSENSIFDIYAGASPKKGIDEFFADEKKLIPGSDQEAVYTSVFSVDGLKKAMSEGKPDLTLDTFMMIDGRTQNVRIHAAFLQNPGSGETESFYTVSVKASDEQAPDRIDSLTGTYTHTGFIAKSREILERTDSYYYLLSIDINGFSQINSAFGMSLGNRILKETASLISDNLKEDEIISRTYGDRFVVLRKNEHTEKDEEVLLLREIADKLKKLLADEGIELEISFSSGAYIIEPKQIFKEDISEMMEKAGTARKSAKELHITGTRMYDSDYHRAKRKEIQLLASFGQAMEAGEIVPYYQAQYDNRTGELVGAETLVRWFSEKYGTVYPGEFIPVLENMGNFWRLDLHMVSCACKLLHSRSKEGKKLVPISVNLSRHDFVRKNFIDKILGIVDGYDIPHNLIHLEITESAYVEDPKLLINSVKRLKDSGFVVEMDDFGSGYSSLNMLKDVPVDVLKLDFRFIQDSASGNGNIILRSIIDMAHAMELGIIAEGVETEEQNELLKSMNCFKIQGYFYARPCPSGEFIKLLDSCPRQNPRQN